MNKYRLTSKYFVTTFLILLFYATAADAQIAMTVEAENATLTGTYDIKSNANASGGTFIALKSPSSIEF